MKFLVDAQLPLRMKSWLVRAKYDAIHTLDLPDGNQTTDERVIEVADHEGRVLVTKDADFVDSHLLRGRPAKLLVVSTGNIGNSELESLFVSALPEIVHEFKLQSFLEIGRSGIVIRG